MYTVIVKYEIIIDCKKALLEPEWSEDIRKNRKEEYILLNNIINSCINKINLSVPSGEIYYLLNSLPKNVCRIRWNEMLNIKLIACDIDGTLLDDKIFQ